jgi:hypothetical protein
VSAPGVNLLPPEYAQQASERRRAVLTVFALLVLVGGFVALYFLKTQSVDAARERRDMAQAEVDRLTAEVAVLQEFSTLASQLDTGNDLLTFAMSSEISFARLLNDVALAFPSTSSLTTMTAGLDVADTTVPVPGAVSSAAGIATLTFSGYSVERYAPGVETVLIEFARIRNIVSDYLETAAGAEIGDVPVTNFNGRADLGTGALTNRYANGLPEDRG